jgi:hypothetical protein
MKWGTQHVRFVAVSVCLAVHSVLLGAATPAAGPIAAEFVGDPVLAAAGDIGVYEFRTLTPVHRFWSPLTGKHFYTIDEAEKNKLINDYPSSTWTYEGIAYYAYTRDSEPGLMPVFRFWSPVTGGHFYTISEAERDKLIDEFEGVWTFEGPAFYAYPPGGQPADAKAVYRFWSPVSSAHFYTINETERNKLINEYAGVWIPEDVAWYAYTDANGVEPTPSGPGTFEFSGGADIASCIFTLKAYVNGVEAPIDNPRLTFTPQTGYLRMAVDFDAMTTTIEEVLVECKSAQHTMTIGGGAQGQVAIPVSMSNSVIFWATTPRGPYRINPQTLTFPISSTTSAGNNETFTLTGSITVEGGKFNAGQAVRATRFTEGRGEFDDDALPEQLSIRMVEPFQWVRSGHEDRLIQTTVGGNQLQLYISGVQVRTTGIWQGVPSN